MALEETWLEEKVIPIGSCEKILGIGSIWRK